MDHKECHKFNKITIKSELFIKIEKILLFNFFDDGQNLDKLIFNKCKKLHFC